MDAVGDIARQGRRRLTSQNGSRDPASDEAYAFRIFVTGGSLRSQRAVENLRGLCRATLGEPAAIEVVDVRADPARAEREKVIATPTVLRLSPGPIRRVLGDLADFDLAASALGLPAVKSAPGLRKLA